MMNPRNFNSKQYDNYLSTFGRQVLQHLVKLLEERNENNKIQVKSRYTYFENKRTLNFSDSHVSPSVTVCQQNALLNESHDNILDKNKLPCRYTTGSKSPITTSHGMLKVAVEDEMFAKGQASIAVNNDSKHDRIEEFSSGKVSNNIRTVKETVTWDNIFDTQLLNDLNILDTESNINTQKPQSEKGKVLQPEYGNDKICYNEVDMESTKTLDLTMNMNLDSKNMLHHRTGAQKINDIHKNVKMEFNVSENADIKKGELKRMSSDMITNVIAKKLKYPTAEVSNNSFRKQKYTKVVKTWLTAVEHENFGHDLELQKNKKTKAKENVLEAMKPNKNKRTKKTVQAQLTNRDGVMKFKKPKYNELPAKPKDIDVATDTKVKEKKAKTKFIAPVKSQPLPPASNVDYNIIHLNDDNFKDYVTELNAVNDKEIPMTLIFSNGFCQLTSRYLNDTFVAEGVMFELNDVIYYWEHIFTSFRWTMERIINHNTIVCYDGKNLIKYFASQPNIDVINTEVKVLDLQIGGNLLDPNKPPEKFTNLQELLRCVPEYTRTECVPRKCAPHLTMLRESFGKLRSLLIDYELWKVFVEIEMRVLPIVADMEMRGVRVDTERLKSMENSLERRLRETELACHAAAGRAFQVNSALQVRTILYEELRLDARSNVRVKETLGKGDKSTSESVLRSLMAVHPLPKLILEYRHVHKAHATFVAGIANHVKDGVVRPTWEQTAAVTGRIACNNPNLQAIPKAPFSLTLFSPDSNEENSSMEPSGTFNFRSVYIPREGYVLLAADFKHIECRVFAYAAADTSLVHALASPDLFRVLAAKWLNKSEEDVSSADRERTKRIVYASLYGAGSRRLMEILGVSYERALAVVASFNRTFPSLKSFGRGVVAQCSQRGGRLATLCGRARSFEHVFSDDPALRSQAERQAVNFIVQGSAADLCKAAMAETERRLRAATPPSSARLLLQIHDELVWEVERGDVRRAAAIIKSAMEGVGAVCGVPVTLPVAITAGCSWGHMEEPAVSAPSPQR